MEKKTHNRKLIEAAYAKTQEDKALVAETERTAMHTHVRKRTINKNCAERISELQRLHPSWRKRRCERQAAREAVKAFDKANPTVFKGE